MNMETVGLFISECRKEKNLSQEQLGEILGVTNKTISRWETGKYLPPADMLLAMSNFFNVSINEILTGERLSDQEYRKAAEDNLIQVLKTSSFTLKGRIEYYKKKWLREHIFFMVIMGFILVAVAVAAVIRRNTYMMITCFVLLPVFHAIRNNAMMAYVENHAFDGTEDA